MDLIHSPLMEVDKRKKRVSRGEVEGDEVERNRLKKLKEEEGGGAGGSGGRAGCDTAVVPAEEEVEEFFAILRRMRVAVKYFDEKGRGGKEWREALEQADVTVDDAENDVDDHHHHREGDDGGAVKKNKGEEEVIINEGLDLNAVAPEAADGGDE